MLEEINISAELFLDKTTVIAGESGTGKSTIMEDALFYLFPHVGEVFIISPSELTDSKIFSKRVRKPFVHYALTESLLQKLWLRATEKTSAYSAGNNIVLLEKLFKRLNLEKINRVLEDSMIKKAALIKNIKDEYLDPNIRQAKIEEIEKKFKEIFITTYKKHISNNKTVLFNDDLTTEEKMCIRYMHFNPKTLIVLDDISTQIKVRTPEMLSILSDIFFRGRHNFITFIISIHDDKLLDTELRKNAFNVIYTTQIAINSFYNKASNGFTSDRKKYVSSIGREVFAEGSVSTDGKPKFAVTKILYIRRDPSNTYAEDCFYKYNATNRRYEEFRFESKALDALCDAIEQSDDSTGSGPTMRGQFFS